MDTALENSSLLRLEGEWTIMRAAELKSEFERFTGQACVVDCSTLERIDLACLQCLWAAHAAGRVSRIVDPQGVVQAEMKRLGIESLFEKVNLSAA